jgi:hypothetical protein
VPKQPFWGVLALFEKSIFFRKFFTFFQKFEIDRIFGSIFLEKAP